ncbi:MAG: methyltransferase domain-containing protein [Moraxellaceae bacterium]|nr:methyltransferase domain-containing protein [Moraxellaceae bacterium]
MTTLRCPLCPLPLETGEKTARCAAGHSFDRAKEGYWHLLPVQQKNSLDPGDDANMVAARQAFLDAGHYQPLRATLSGLIAPLHAKHLLDSGCGEGWYTSALRDIVPNVTALDISKHAIRRAARRRRDITWLVASSMALPLLDVSVDVITAIFSPLDLAECARVLRPGGHLVIAAPGEKHLWELRAALYEEVRPPVPEKWQAQCGDTFTLTHEARTGFTMPLASNASVNQLLMMTPHYWRAPRERRDAVAAYDALTVQADFQLLVFRKTPTS